MRQHADILVCDWVSMHVREKVRWGRVVRWVVVSTMCMHCHVEREVRISASFVNEYGVHVHAQGGQHVHERVARYRV